MDKCQYLLFHLEAQIAIGPSCKQIWIESAALSFNFYHFQLQIYQMTPTGGTYVDWVRWRYLGAGVPGEDGVDGGELEFGDEVDDQLALHISRWPTVVKLWS